jgi:hypothetical protein
VLQAILLTSSLLLVFGMCASLMWLASVRAPDGVETLSAQSPEPDG